MRTCDACGLALPPNAVALRVGACEFPFYLHEDCRNAMAPISGAIEEMCRWSEDQPEGLLYLGSWSASAGEDPDDHRNEER